MAVATLTVAGCLLAAAIVGRGVVGMAVTAALVTACISPVVRADDGGGTRTGVRAAFRDATVAAALMGALVGWVALAGAAALVLLPVVSLTSPGATRVVRARLGHERPAGSTAPALERIDSTDRPTGPCAIAPGRVASATTQQIVSTWLASGVELKRERPAHDSLQLVRLRQACLDELERRDQAALQCWLASGPSVAGDPTRYFKPDDPVSGAAS